MSPTVLVVGGPTASGKTTVASGVADRLGWTFIDADDLHPADNVARMSAGMPLSEEHRRPWLDAVIGAARACAGDVAVACSALRIDHRDRLRRGAGARIVMLRPDLHTATQRAAARSDHFMPASLVASQFDTVEWPTDTESDVWTLDANHASVDRLVEAVIARLHAH